MERYFKWERLEITYAEYCESKPVRDTKWGMKDPDNRVGEHPDQYETLKDFMVDVWSRYRPHGGKHFFSEEGIYQIAGTDELICKNEESRFYNQVVENYYLTRPRRYNELRQHYFCNTRKHKVY